MSEVNEKVLNILESRTVLVVDAEEDLCDLIKQDLKSAGMHVDSAHDVHNGDKLIRSGKYDVLLVDKKVKGVSSDSLISAAKEYGMKVVKLSTDTNTNHHFDAAIGKPFEPSELMHVVRSV